MPKQTRPSRKGLPIAAHKQGRSKNRLSVQATDEVLAMIRELKSKYGISISDIVAEAVPRKYRRMKND